MTTLVIGATGQTGKILVRRGKGRIVGTGSADLDLGDAGRIQSVIDEVRPDVVLIPGGITNVDTCEKDPARAMAVNGEGLGLVAEIAKDAYVLFVSTDYVFDGAGGPYPEEAEPKPINHYGISKVEGERRVLARGNTAVVRTCSVFSHDPGGRNFFMQVHEKLRRGEEQPAFEDQYLTPTWAETLAASIIELAEDRRPGLFHVAGGEFVNRVDFCLRLAKSFGFDEGLVRPVPTASVPLPARRPLRAGLLLHRSSLRTPMIPASETLSQISGAL